MTDILPTLLWTIILASFAWFFMVKKVFAILKLRHQKAYDSLGKPSRLFRHGFRKNFGALLFLTQGLYTSLNDGELTRLCNFMRSFLYCYSVFFMTFIALLATSIT